MASGIQTHPLNCPNCKQSITLQQRTCAHCGMEISVSTALADARWSQPAIAATKPLPPLESLIPRLGSYLIEKGLLTANDLQRALAYQKEKEAQGENVLLGQALLQLNLINQESLDRAVTKQIIQYQLALQSANRELEDRVQKRTAELEDALKKLSELNQLKSNLIANVSHELRTPLTHIKGYIELLKDNSIGTLNTEQQHAIEVAYRASNRLESLIEDLIRYSLISRGELSLNVTRLQIPILMQTVLAQTRSKASEKGIVLQTKVTPDIPDIQGDEEKLVWAMAHLVENAIKFTPSGGQIILMAQADHHLVTLAVLDTGIGIPQERFGELFEPFHQLDGSSTRRYGGTGLGLALVKRIIQAHGSTVAVQSKVDQGSRFFFTMHGIGTNH